jgi:hypothetical protein
MAGGGVFITANDNIVQDNVIAGAFAKAVDVGSGVQNNVIQRNRIGTRADGSVPAVPAAAQCLRSFNYDTQNWYGGWGIAISGSNNKVLENRIAGLHILQSANDTPPIAIELFGANHLVQDNVIGVDSAGSQVGVCGQGIKVSGSGTHRAQPHRLRGHRAHSDPGQRFVTAIRPDHRAPQSGRQRAGQRLRLWAGDCAVAPDLCAGAHYRHQRGDGDGR